MSNDFKIALLSVSEKEGLVSFADKLIDNGYTLLVTGTTGEVVRSGVKYDENARHVIIDIEDYIDMKSSPGGYVKTLHPKIHGGFIMDPKNPEHKEWVIKYGIFPIEILVCDPYPFEKVIKEKDVTFNEAVESIDVGGHAMIRDAMKAALKGNEVYVFTDHEDYALFLPEKPIPVEEIGVYPMNLRKYLAKKAARLIANYDNAIADYLENNIRTQFD